MKKKIVFALILAAVCIFVLVACAAAMDTKAEEKTDEVTLVMPLSAEEIIAKTPAGDIMLGDVDGDGAVTNADVLMIYRYIYNPALYPLPTICDHTFGEWTEEAPLTCTTDGKITRTCTKCSMVENSTLKGGHAYEALAGSPSQYTCLRCGDTYKGTVTFTVTFVDYDGKVLKTETVESGMSATAPSDPTRDGYIFAGWDKAFDNVTSDLTIVAQYVKEITNPTFVLSDVQANAGDTNVTVIISVKNNPGILGAICSISYDSSALTLTNAVNRVSATGVSYTPPSQYKNPTNFVWDAQDLTWTEDGIILTLTFNVSATAASGNYSITLEYDPYDVFDGEGEPIDFEVINATVEVR